MKHKYKLLKNLIKSTNYMIDTAETCDHSVGICYCDFWNDLYDNKKLIEEVTEKNWEESGIETTPLVNKQMYWFEDDQNIVYNDYVIPTSL